MPPPDNVILSTRYNFLKIYLNGQVSIAISATTPTDYLVATHSLGYIPRARVWYEPVAGQVWPMASEQYAATTGGTGTTLPIIGDFYLTSSGLYVHIQLATAATILVYYRIYADG